MGVSLDPSRVLGGGIFLAVVVDAPVDKSIKASQLGRATPQEADRGRDDFALFDGYGWPNLGGARIETVRERELIRNFLELGGEGE